MNDIDFQFQGVDFMELAEKWQIPEHPHLKFPDDYDTVSEYSQPLQHFLEHLITESHMTGDEQPLRKYAEDVRYYLFLLSIKDKGYYGPMWRGMSKITDDYSLLRIAIPLIPYMWT